MHLLASVGGGSTACSVLARARRRAKNPRLCSNVLSRHGRIDGREQRERQRVRALERRERDRCADVRAEEDHFVGQLARDSAGRLHRGLPSLPRDSARASRRAR
jgi:hypothetical protein